VPARPRSARSPCSGRISRHLWELTDAPAPYPPLPFRHLAARTPPIGLLAVAASTFALTAGAQAAPPAPVNDRPNPYQTIVGWAKLPQGRTWGATSAVDIDKDGKHIWVAERCGANSCASSEWPSVLKFDPSGTLVIAFGEGLLMSPHGIHVDRDGNIWAPTALHRGAPPRRSPRREAGHQIFVQPRRRCSDFERPAADATHSSGCRTTSRPRDIFRPRTLVTRVRTRLFVRNRQTAENRGTFGKAQQTWISLTRWHSIPAAAVVGDAATIAS
jgi:hypothetical protein